ncbi:metallo-beta-lactamase family hydrolase [Streptomyces sp. 769]|nr:metallo-beta-lactamase family hydrolase [Streptomyces sp. 769]
MPRRQRGAHGEESLLSHPHPELGAPPKLPEGGLRVTPLGGLGEIGRNMTVFEYGGRLLIVDCGVLFPEEEQPGIDLILPDFTSVRDRLDDIDGIVLTHGHEDHIGGVPYLLREKPDIPLIGSKLTLALIEAKLQEHRIRPYTLEVAEGDRERLGPFECQFVAVNHSIPDALAVAIRTPAGMVVHTGDFKMDQLPLDRRLTDLPAFAKLGEEGIDLLLSDSTNAEVPGFVPPERDISNVLRQVFASAQKRIIVASFASHVHRIQQILDAAHEYGRRVAFVGRSMVRNMGIARELGYLNVPAGLVVDVKTLDDLPDDEVVLVCTGSQGEPMAALSRMANRDHQIRIVQGDTVILASSLIPGNENAVYRVINGLSRWGANVVHKGNAKVHVSGHASAGELLYFYNICKPKNLMPVHGEWRHLRANAELGALTGIPKDRIVIAEDGVVVDLVNGIAKIAGKVQAGYVYVDGLSVGDVTEAHLKDRRILGDEGIISIFVVVDSSTGKTVGGPNVHARGSGIDDKDFSAVVPKIDEALAKAAQDGIAEPHQLQQLIRRAVGKWVSDNYRRRPMILPVVVEV